MIPRRRPAPPAVASLSLALPLACFALIAFAGCTNPKLLDANRAFRAGDVPAARTLIDRVAQQSANGNDRLLAHLEQGAIALAAGDPAAADRAFAKADADARYFDRRPDISLSAELAATAINLNALPYRGRPHDLIMLDTYQALIALERGNTAAARVELRQALERQQQAARNFAEQINKQQAALDQANAKAPADRRLDIDRTLDDPAVAGRLARLNQSVANLTPYTDFVNPFTETLRGIVFLHAPADSADHENARFALDRALGLVPGQTYLAEDLADAAALAQQGTPPPPSTHAFLFAGTAPFFTSFRIDLPLFIFNDRVDYVGVNFPSFNTGPPATPRLTALPEHAGRPATTLGLVDFDRVIGADYDARLPGIILRTLLNAAAKAGAAYALNEATRGDDVTNVLVRIATSAYQAVANQADLRTFAALPRRIDYARLPTPDAGRITLQTPDHAPLTVNVEPGRANIVLVFSPHPGGDVAVYSFPIEPTR
ncbi:MAG: hypothetical protein AAGI54_06250 [Planctomycetota bacterium]